MATELSRVMLVTDRRRTRGRPLAEVVGETVCGGVGIVQFRERGLSADARRALFLRVRDAIDGKALLVVNRADELAPLADGVHRPAADLDESGHGGVCGRSVHDREELERALAREPDYLVAGTVFPTAAKPGRIPAGLRFVEEAARIAGPVPVYAIGGVTPERAGAVLAAGAYGVAVAGALLAADEPARVAQALALATRSYSRRNSS